MLSGKTVVVVVPAYEEERHVGQVITTMPAFVDTIVVVDDASPDTTSKVARETCDPRLVLVRHHRRRGVGAAIATGYAEARAITGGEGVIAVMAGDGQMAPEDLERVVLPIVLGHADYVKGDRFGMPGVQRAMGWSRWFGGQVFSRLTGLAIGQPISDSQCGYTALSGAVLQRLELGKMWPSFGYPNDLLGTLAAAGARIAEVPVKPVYGSEISKLRLRHLPPIFFLLGRAALRRVSSKRATSPKEAKSSTATYHAPDTGCERRDPTPRAGV